MTKSQQKNPAQENNGQATAGTNEAAGNNNPAFAIQRIYLKDLSFETPNSPQIFREKWSPNVHLELNVNSHKLEQDIFEVILQITTTVKSNEKVAFLAEIHQAGIFSLESFNDQQIHHTLGSYCPNILFPYARETISNLVVRGGFPQLYLAPINFDAVYAQQMQQQQQTQQPEQNEAQS